MPIIITEDFSLDEFVCPDGCGANHIHEGIIHRLQVIRDIVKTPIIITSGVRCCKHNDELGGAINSYHLPGWAVDWTMEDPKTLEWTAKTLLHNWSGGFHWSPEKKFIHCDIGPRRRWL